MTVIVGYKHKGVGGKKDIVYIGGDSLGASGYDITERVDEKVFVVHGIAYGFTSSYRMGQILRYHSEEIVSELRYVDLFAYIVTELIPMWKRIMKDHGYMTISNNNEKGGEFLVGIDGRLFKISSDFQVGESLDRYSATGCGRSYALGYLYSTSIKDNPVIVVNRAVKAAIKFSGGCGGNIKIVRSTIPPVKRPPVKQDNLLTKIKNKFLL